MTSKAGLGPLFCAAYRQAGFKNPERMLDDHDYCMRQEKLHPDWLFTAMDILGSMMSDIIAKATPQTKAKAKRKAPSKKKLPKEKKR